MFVDISKLVWLHFISGMEAWKDLFVPASVLIALKENGFTYPTPIQAQVLPPAIRDKMDILGAAETVCICPISNSYIASYPNTSKKMVH